MTPRSDEKHYPNIFMRVPKPVDGSIWICIMQNRINDAIGKNYVIPNSAGYGKRYNEWHIERRLKKLCAFQILVNVMSQQNSERSRYKCENSEPVKVIADRNREICVKSINLAIVRETHPVNIL